MSRLVGFAAKSAGMVAAFTAISAWHDRNRTECARGDVFSAMPIVWDDWKTWRMPWEPTRWDFETAAIPGWCLRLDLADSSHSGDTEWGADLSGKLGDTGATALAKALPMSSVAHLDLRHNEISNPGAAAVAEALTAGARINFLDMSDNWIHDGGCDALATALATNTVLTKLFLHTNVIGPGGGRSLGTALETNRAITTLSLQRNRLKDGGAIALARAMERNSDLAITGLYLAKNDIGDPGAAALGAALGLNVGSVEQLDLAYNWIHDEGGAALAAGLTTNALVKGAFLEGNRIANIGCTAFGKMLSVNTMLETLDLSDNFLEDQGGFELAKGIGANPDGGLGRLHLQHNHLGDGFAWEMAKALEVNIRLEELHIQFNRIRDIGVNALAAALRCHDNEKCNLTLRHLSLGVGAPGRARAEANHFSSEASRARVHLLAALPAMERKAFSAAALQEAIDGPKNSEL